MSSEIRLLDSYFKKIDKKVTCSSLNDNECKDEVSSEDEWNDISDNRKCVTKTGSSLFNIIKSKMNHKSKSSSETKTTNNKKKKNYSLDLVNERCSNVYDQSNGNKNNQNENLDNINKTKISNNLFINDLSKKRKISKIKTKSIKSDNKNKRYRPIKVLQYNIQSDESSSEDAVDDNISSVTMKDKVIVIQPSPVTEEDANKVRSNGTDFNKGPPLCSESDEQTLEKQHSNKQKPTENSHSHAIVPQNSLFVKAEAKKKLPIPRRLSGDVKSPLVGKIRKCSLVNINEEYGNATRSNHLINGEHPVNKDEKVNSNLNNDDYDSKDEYMNIDHGDNINDINHDCFDNKLKNNNIIAEDETDFTMPSHISASCDPSKERKIKALLRPLQSKHSNNDSNIFTPRKENIDAEQISSKCGTAMKNINSYGLSVEVSDPKPQVQFNDKLKLDLSLDITDKEVNSDHIDKELVKNVELGKKIKKGKERNIKKKKKYKRRISTSQYSEEYPKSKRIKNVKHSKSLEFGQVINQNNKNDRICNDSSNGLTPSSNFNIFTPNEKNAECNRLESKDLPKRRSSRTNINTNNRSIYIENDSNEENNESKDENKSTTVERSSSKYLKKDKELKKQSKSKILKPNKNNSGKTQSVPFKSDSEVPLASIFSKKSVIKKTQQICPLKKAFLCSGVPEQLKTKFVIEKREVVSLVFTPTCHVTQSHLDPRMFELMPTDVGFESKLTSSPLSSSGGRFRWNRNMSCLPTRIYERKKMKDMSSRMIKNEIQVIQEYCNELSAKSLYKSLLEQFKTYKHGEAWTDKYSPISRSTIIGNNQIKKKFYFWLNEWQLSLKENQKATNSDVYYSDSENEELSNLCNLGVFTGPGGVGKTSVIHGIANQLDFKVFEVNCTSSRKAQYIMSRLKEATQSHHIAHKEKTLFKKTKTANSQDNSTVKKQQNSLILFDEIDICFKKDKSFLSAVNTFVEKTKRPIILTSRTLNSDLPSRFQHFPVVAPSITEVVAYMKLICLVEKIKPKVNFKDLELLVKIYSCDIRKCLNTLQFIAESGSYNNKFNFFISMNFPNLVLDSKTSISDVLRITGQSLDIDLLQVPCKNESKDIRTPLQRLERMASIAESYGIADIIRGNGELTDDRWFKKRVPCSESNSLDDDRFDSLEIVKEIEYLTLSTNTQDTFNIDNIESDLIDSLSVVYDKSEKFKSKYAKSRHLVTSIDDDDSASVFTYQPMRSLRLDYTSTLGDIAAIERRKQAEATRKRHFLHYMNHSFDLKLLDNIETEVCLQLIGKPL